MCGIAGFVGEGGIEDLRRMNAALVHRGPDDEGVWVDEANRVFLGHRRLSIMDIAGGHQPMWTEDGQLGVVFNGEIYNHLELREELTGLGHRFQTDHSDTEVLLHGYRAWGEAFTNRLNGMWSFVIYDRTRRLLFGSRDRFGKKPFFYAAHRGGFVFGSELSAIVGHPAINAGLSFTALKKYFAYGYIPAPHSIYEGVFKLPGGHSLRYDLSTQTTSVRKYWDFIIEPFDSVPARPEEEWGGRLIELLSAAVKRRLMADVPLGFFLSGGIDSSSVVALASRHIPRERINTFSIGFEEETFDESAYSSAVATRLGTSHRCDKLSLKKALSLLSEVVSKLDEPMGDSSLLPTYLLCGHARSHVTVALGGDGADELFAGYDPFRALRAAQLYDRLVPRKLHQGIRLLVSRLPVSHANMSLDFKLKRTLRGLSYPAKLWCPTWMGPLEPSEISELFGEPVDQEELYSEAIEAWEACRQGHLVDRVLQFYTKLYLQDDILVKVDRASMMHSLEVRAPYLDIELVDFVRRIPHDYKCRNGQTKYLLKKALDGILPRSVLYRSKKGFGVPIGEWLKKGLVAMETDAMPFAVPGFIESRLHHHQEDRSDERAFLWSSWLLQAFLARHSEHSAVANSASSRLTPVSLLA
jgi:asparagine synthase (glutamine-hydrolysing)